MVLQDRDYVGDGPERSKAKPFPWLMFGLGVALALVAAALVLRYRAPVVDTPQPPLAGTGTAPSAIPSPTDIERVRVSMYGVRIIPCSSADLYEGEPPPSLCLYAENGHVSQAHLAPTAAPQ